MVPPLHIATSEEPSRPDGVRPSLKKLRERCDIPASVCPAEGALLEAEGALLELWKEQQKRIFSESQLATNIDRIADASTRSALAVEGLDSRLNEIVVGQKELEKRVVALGNLRWWVAAVIAGVELARTSGFWPVLKSLMGAP